MKVIYDSSVPFGRVNRITGEIRINPTIPPNLQKFIIEHEKGHYYLNTSDEYKADEYAIIHTYKTIPQSLKNIARSIFLLNPEKYQNRIENVLQKIALIDLYFNNNLKVTHMILNKQQEHLLMNMLVDYLKSKGYKSVSDLPEAEKQRLLVEFFERPDVAYMLAKISNNYNDFLGDVVKKVGQGLDKISPIIGVAATAVGTALGVPVPPQIGDIVTNALGKGLEKAGDLINQRQQQNKQEEKQNTSQAPQPQNQPQQTAIPQPFIQPPAMPTIPQPIIAQPLVQNQTPLGYSPQNSNRNLIIFGLIAVGAALAIYFITKR